MSNEITYIVANNEPRRDVAIPRSIDAGRGAIPPGSDIELNRDSLSTIRRVLGALDGGGGGVGRV